MMNGLLMDNNLSNIASSSNEGNILAQHNRNENGIGDGAAHPAKKKRNLPGNPDPEGEIISLSPTTLLATNRFVCEICHKGFQREQNLQLHRRGHNLPWKLKQRANKEVKKKFYVCPEPTCVHHDPSRALGDLTGVKKHFSRKHGEKKWKCDKCAKRYAVQSDWKAHAKICGTREYRCDCGTVFSRRDSFVTHRAFCDALTQETARAIPPINTLLSSQPGTSTTLFSFQTQLHNQDHQDLQRNKEVELHQSFALRPPEVLIPPWLVGSTSNNELSPELFTSRSSDQPMLPNLPIVTPENPNQNPMFSSGFPHMASSHMSATALLQKAAEMGVAMSKNCQSEASFKPNMSGPDLNTTLLASSTGGSRLGLSSHYHGMISLMSKGVNSGGIEQISSNVDVGIGASSLLCNAISTTTTSLQSINGGFERSTFDDSFNVMANSKNDHNNFQETIITQSAGAHLSSHDGLTRDFLGLTSYPQRNFPFISCFDNDQIGVLSYDQHTQNQAQWHG